MSQNIVPLERINNKIYHLRGLNVMLDFDLADLYQVETRALNQAVKRNIDRFPDDFMFQLSSEEFEILRSQIVTSSWGGNRYLPYAFTEQGIAMLSSVLRSKKAVDVNIAIMRTFVKLREMMLSQADLQRKIESMEKKYDENFSIIFDALRELIATPEQKKHPIGFIVHEDE